MVVVAPKEPFDVFSPSEVLDWGIRTDLYIGLVPEGFLFLGGASSAVRAQCNYWDVWPY